MIDKQYPLIKWVRKGGISSIEEKILNRFFSKKFSIYEEFARCIFNEHIDSWNEYADRYFPNTGFDKSDYLNYLDYIRREYDKVVKKEARPFVYFGDLRVEKINKEHDFTLVWRIGPYRCIQCCVEYSRQWKKEHSIF